MANRKLRNDLRAHRRKSGLTQRQLGQLLGYQRDVQVSRHETATAVPLFVSAVGYQIIFRVPMQTLFPGIYEEVKESIERRLREFETALHSRSVRGPEAEVIAQILLWMMERREHDIETPDAG